MKFVKNAVLILVAVWLSACGEGDSKTGYEAANQPPISDAGVAQNVVAGSTVTLDGSASRDANGDTLTFEWTLTSKPTGSIAVLSGGTSAKPTFTADLAGAYVASLVVNDSKTRGNTATVAVTATIANAAPVANAGTAQSVVAGSTVTLDGSASSDANGDTLTFSWTLTSKPTGSNAVLTDGTSAKPTFIADLSGTYVATLIVNDGKIDSTPSTVTVTASSTNAAPFADPGVAQNVTTGSTVTLDGSASRDANGDPLTYRWSLTAKPAGSIASLSGSIPAKPTFIADLSGTYVATLIVNDGKIDSTPSTVTVTASPPKLRGVGYVAPNGMTVTLTDFKQSDLGNGYIRYTATYLQENKTLLSIDEGSLLLYFKNADPKDQYGFFGKILPGPSFALTRSYSWEVLSSSVPMLLQYKSNFFGEPVAGSLHWIFPIK